MRKEHWSFFPDSRGSQVSFRSLPVFSGWLTSMTHQVKLGNSQNFTSGKDCWKMHRCNKKKRNTQAANHPQEICPPGIDKNSACPSSFPSFKIPILKSKLQSDAQPKGSTSFLLPPPLFPPPRHRRSQSSSTRQKQEPQPVHSPVQHESKSFLPRAPQVSVRWPIVGGRR